MRVWLVLKNGYVIDRVVWDGETPYTYPYDHDALIEDVDQEVHIGSKYDQKEDAFYWPYKQPKDNKLPDRLKGVWKKNS